MKVTFYGYPKCGTCRKAEQWLRARKMEVDYVDVTLNPPPLSVLKAALSARDGKIGKLFNTSGEQYKALKMKDKLPTLSETDALKLLSGNGRLVKRPIVIAGARVTVGFDEEEFGKVWKV